MSKTIYVDMDGVIADFDAKMEETGMTGKALKMVKGIYLTLSPIKGFIEALNELELMGYNIHIATKIPDDNPYAATEKLLWLEDHFPDILPNVTITPDKGQLGTVDDFLIDDRIHKAQIHKFQGTVLHFGCNGEYKNWNDIITYFRKLHGNTAA